MVSPFSPFQWGVLDWWGTGTPCQALSRVQRALGPFLLQTSTWEGWGGLVPPQLRVPCAVPVSSGGCCAGNVSAPVRESPGLRGFCCSQLKQLCLNDPSGPSCGGSGCSLGCLALLRSAVQCSPGMGWGVPPALGWSQCSQFNGTWECWTLWAQ